MVVGVPASGKSWVCEQLTHRFSYVPNDDYIGNKGAYMSAVYRALNGAKPVLLDVPFKERELRAELEAMGIAVHAYFVVTPVETLKERYAARGKGDLPKASVTRATSIINRANEWGAPYGSSAHILSLLRQA